MKTPTEKGIINIGEREVREETMPEGAFFSAARDRVNPIMGPRTEPTAMLPNAFMSLKEALISGHFFLRVINTVKDMKAAIILIWVAARGGPMDLIKSEMREPISTNA